MQICGTSILHGQTEIEMRSHSSRTASGGYLRCEVPIGCAAILVWRLSGIAWKSTKAVERCAASSGTRPLSRRAQDLRFAFLRLFGKGRESSVLFGHAPVGWL